MVWVVYRVWVVAVLVLLCVFVGVAEGVVGGRVYEQVSPEYKGGYGAINISMVSGDGEDLAFESLGVFDGLPADELTNLYLAHRVEGVGWETSPLEPPLANRLSDFSSSFGSVLARGSAGATKVGGRNIGADFLLHGLGSPDGEAGWELFGGMVLTTEAGEPFEGGEVGASQDLCHIILSEGANPEAPLVGEAAAKPIYDFSRGCGGGEPYVRLVGVNNAGASINSHCSVGLGLPPAYIGTFGETEQEGSFHPVSMDGSMVFFTTDAAARVESDCGVGDHQLFVRLGGEKTVEVSKPLSEEGSCLETIPCPGSVGRASANFKGASEDGSHVFFTSHAPLVDEDTDTSNNLYMAVVGCGEGEAGCGAGDRRVVSMAQASRDVGGPADVLGVVRVAPDGSCAYLVAQGVLSEGVNAEGRAPVDGADNMYVYNAVTGKVSFIADMCSGPLLSGGIEDSECPADLSSRTGF